MEMSSAMQEPNVLPEESLEVVTRGRLVPEVWLNVFDKLDESDKPAFSRACPEWHGWMKGKRTLFLFQEVAPLLLDILPTPSLLKNREICETWTEIGDHHVHSHPSQFELETLQCEGTVVEHFSQFSNRFSTAADVQKFVNEMETHPGNPFPGRMLEFFWRNPKRLQERNGEESYRLCKEYWSSLPPLLQKYGTHVTNAVFNPSDDSAIIGTEFDCILRTCLLLLPNLKRLDICGRRRLSEKHMVRFYRRGQLPQLEHLETLGMMSVNYPLVLALLRSCCIPTKLKRLAIDLSWNDLVQLPLQHFINLEALSGKFTVENLESISNLPLRTLEVVINWKFGRYFNAIAAFGNTLTQLVLHDTYLKEPENRSGLRFNLPNLKRLEIAEYTGSLEFFFQLKALTELEFGQILTSDQGETERVQDFQFEKMMMESNIWSLMPSLQTLKLYGFSIVYERDEREGKIFHKNFY